MKFVAARKAMEFGCVKLDVGVTLSTRGMPSKATSAHVAFANAGSSAAGVGVTAGVGVGGGVGVCVATSGGISVASQSSAPSRGRKPM